jgi:chaperone BCS1
MADTLKQEIITDSKRFIDTEDWYIARGIPYRRGYLFYGPPGTGKTTMAVALAGHLNRPVYVLNLSTVGDDDSLQEAFSTVDSEGIVLLEDVDAFSVAQSRGDAETPEETPAQRRRRKREEEEDEDFDDDDEEFDGRKSRRPKTFGPMKAYDNVTLSGVLNAIDGVIATEGRILIMTTNHIERLDPALIRSGRVDVQFEITPLLPQAVCDMFNVFYPDNKDLTPRIRTYAESVTMTAAKWQELFIHYHDNVDGLLASVGV